MQLLHNENGCVNGLFVMIVVEAGPKSVLTISATQAGKMAKSPRR